MRHKKSKPNLIQFVKYEEVRPIESEIMAMYDTKYLMLSIQFYLKQNIKYFLEKKLKNKRGEDLLQH